MGVPSLGSSPRFHIPSSTAPRLITKPGLIRVRYTSSTATSDEGAITPPIVDSEVLLSPAVARLPYGTRSRRVEGAEIYGSGRIRCSVVSGRGRGRGMLRGTHVQLDGSTGLTRLGCSSASALASPCRLS